MNAAQARDVVLAALADVAPEIDADALDPAASLRDGAELDSMDFLAFVAALSGAIGADIPEDEYAQVDGLAKAAQYVAEHG